MTRNPDSGSVDLAFASFVRTGNPGDLAKVFDKTAPELLRLASHLVSDLSLAEDLVQATFLAAIESRRDYAPTAPVLQWLTGILTNRARELRRKTERRPDPERLCNHDPREPSQEAASTEISEAVSNAIAGLPEPYRPVLLMHLKLGRPVPEIALVLGRAPGTVRKQISRGMEMLRKTLPSGFAAMLSSTVLPSQGLVAMKQAVVSAASLALPASAAVPSAIGGFLLMKKTTLMAISVLGVASFAWLAWPAPETQDPLPAFPAPAVAMQADPAPGTPLERNAIDASVPGSGSVTYRIRTVHDGEAELVVVQDLELVHGGSVSGTVLRPSGEPAGLTLVELHRQGTRLAHTTTEASGSFRLPVAEDGLYDLLAADGLHGVAFRGDLPLRADRDHRQDLDLVPRSELRGQIVYPDGEPIEGLDVRALRSSYPDDPSPDRTGAAGGGTRTGADGRFAFRGLRPGQYRLYMPEIEDEVLSEHYLHSFFETDKPEARIVLPVHRLTVELTDDNGNVLTEGRVLMMGYRAEDGADVRRLLDGVPLPEGIDVANFLPTTARDNAHFVPRGSWWVIEGSRGENRAWTLAEAPSHRNETTVRVEVGPTDLSAGVHVTVKASDGAALDGVMVTLSSIVPGIHYSRKRRDGGTTIDVDAPPGAYSMWVYGFPEADYPPLDRPVDLVSGRRQEFDITLSRGGRLFLSVHAQGMQPGDQLGDVEVDVSGPESRTLEYFSRRDESGSFSSVLPASEEAFGTQLLRAGQYEVTIRVDGYRTFRTTAVVRGGEDTPVDVVLER